MNQSQQSNPAILRYPRGLPYIVSNEAAERFSYYGMKAILVVFMTKYLADTNGNPAPMTEAQATAWYHLFGTANYLTPIIGAFLADIFWGKYRTIIWLSAVYCLGHVVLAVSPDRFGLAAGLLLIALGSGGIKPCVSSHLGDQFSTANASLLTKAFAAFYLSINIGAMISVLLTPWLLEHYGPHVAFAVPGVLMLIATVVFWMGRNKFVAIPPVGWAEYRAEFAKPDTKSFLPRLALVYVFIAFFWSLYDQTGSTWVLQAERLDRTVSLFGFTFEVLPSQLQTLNPLMILIFTPLSSYWLFPLLEKRGKLSAIGKIRCGMFLAAVSFLIVAAAELQLAAGGSASMMYQVVAYLFLTAGEVLVSITSLEFAYTQAAPKLKSFVMSFYLLSVALGNVITAGIVKATTGADGLSVLTHAQLFLGFACGLGIAALVMRGGLVERMCLQGEEDEGEVMVEAVV